MKTFFGQAGFLENQDITELEALLIKDGKIIPVQFTHLNKFPQEQISVFCHKHGIYQIPTTELIYFLASEMEDLPTIEIGAGNGCIGRQLGIEMYDNKMQEWPAIKAQYNLMNQPTIKYGVDVIEMSGNDAVKKTKPVNVIACWVTQRLRPGLIERNPYGVDENQMFIDGIKKYIHVGNELTHGTKKILKQRPYIKLKFPGLISRSMSRDENVIYIIT